MSAGVFVVLVSVLVSCAFDAVRVHSGHISFTTFPSGSTFLTHRLLGLCILVTATGGMVLETFVAWFLDTTVVFSSRYEGFFGRKLLCR